MIGPLLRQRLISVYHSFLANDFLNLVREKDDPNASNPASMRHLLQEMMNPESTYFPKATRLQRDYLDKTLVDLLNLQFTDEDGEVYPFKIHVFRIFCLDVVQDALNKAFPFSEAEGHAQAALLAESSSCSLEDLTNRIFNGNTHFAIAELFMDEVESLWGARPLRSFFYRERDSHGFFDGRPAVRMGLSEALPTATYHTPMGQVTVQVCVDAATEGFDVRPYEWHADLREVAGSLVPDAVASGTAYCFARNKHGRPYAGVVGLVESADTMADVDVLEAVAFINQHHDSEDLVCDGDLSFVRICERREGAHKGVGRICLQTALSDLWSRFKEMTTVIVDVKPSQFASFVDQIDPPEIVIKKQLAIDAVLSWLEDCRLDQRLACNVRPIFNNFDADPNAVLQLVRHAVYGDKPL